MQKKLTITLDERVYKGLHTVVGKRRISKFIEQLVRPHVIDKDLDRAYRLMAQDEEREAEALEWSEGTIGDVADEAREVWWVNFEPAVGGEVRKERPAVIVSNDSSNKHLNRLQVIPLSTSVAHLYPSEALVTVRGKKHKAMADQICTVSKSRLDNRMGKLSDKEMAAIETTIKVQLGLEG